MDEQANESKTEGPLPSFKAMMESDEGGAKDVAMGESHEHLRLVERVLNVLDGSDPMMVATKKFDFCLLTVIDIFYENVEFRQCLNQYINSLSETCKTLLDSIKEIRKIAEVKLTASNITETLRDKQLHEMFHESVKTRKDAGLLMSQLMEKEANLNWKLLTKDGLIKKYKEDLSFKKWENSIKIKKEMVHSNQKMEEIWTESEQRRVQLEEELKEAKLTYSKILTENLRKDKSLRQRRNRLLLQLQAFIKKFDHENFEKIKEIERLDEERQEMQKKFDDFMEIFNQLNSEYIVLKQQKDTEAKKSFEHKLMMFILNRAAKVIQRAWRVVIKARRKKGKKGKKKK
ncbi:uncharacterized protein LOC129611620 [Condylostylus longicornis]|uniref:uncharacterized protein LOC129611620 n=1 Tax=Condylostylus longicornis TaxID=2530218 RepID=UPI00244DE11C|nr:uncharacterized protein LOC129611620 [Condylostylus longicornis]